MKNKILIIVATLVLLGTIILVTKPEYRWLVINGNKAEIYAIELLRNNNQKTPDWAIDLVVTKENRRVTFGEHNSKKMYVFSPDGAPNKDGITWAHIWGSWYVGIVQT